MDADFYFADLLSDENETLKDSLDVLLKSDYYKIEKEQSASGIFDMLEIRFRDNQKSHRQFWNKYKRPPAEELWN